MTLVHHSAQGGLLELAVLAEAPVVGDDGEVADALRWLLFLDDQQAVEPARHLFPGAFVRVVPEGAGVGYREAVVAGPARLDRVLGKVRQAGHGVVDGEAEIGRGTGGARGGTD